MKEGRGGVKGGGHERQNLTRGSGKFYHDTTTSPPPSPLDDENRLLKRCKKFLNLRTGSVIFFSFQFFPANGGRLIRWSAREEGKNRWRKNYDCSAD